MSEARKSETVTAHRVATMAAAARVPLDPTAPERIAQGTTGPAARFAAENLAMPMEVEPATFVAVGRGDIGR